MKAALHRKLLRDLLRHRAQVITIALVVACGVAVFVSSVSLYRSLAWSRDSFYAQGRLAHLFARVERAPDLVAQRLEEVPGVAVVERRIAVGVTLLTEAVEEPVVAQVVSLPERGQPRLGRLHLTEGRLPDPLRTDEVVAAELFAEAHGWRPGSRLVAVLNGRATALTVVGVGLSPEWVYALPPSGLPDEKRYGVLWMGERALAAAYDLDGAFNEVAMTLAPGARAEAVTAGVDRVLAPWGSRGATTREDLPSYAFVEEELDQSRAMALFLPVVFLGVAAFLLNVVLARVVSAERMQIATLKALGYRGRTVGRHYLGFVLVIVLLGLAAGLALGVGFGRWQLSGYDRFLRFPEFAFRLEPWVVVVAGAVALAAGVGAALGAVRRVSRLPPAQAMRPESPDAYRSGLVERLGLPRVLSPQALLVARTVSRRPLRAAFTILGVAFATAIVVAGLFFNDALGRLIDLVFIQSQREDVTLAFLEPVSERALRELETLPGVLSVEGIRSVPVRFEAGSREERTVLTGQRRDARLRRVLDARGRPVVPPPEGVLLGDILAERLGVGRGSRVEVEVMEGGYPVRSLRVAGVFRELGGLTAVMERDALHGWLRETPVVSGAAVRLSGRERPAFNRALRARPAIASVTLGPELVRSFRKTMAEIIGVFATTMTLFAAAIAVGVIYNGARIAFAERARDLASLRVLGFTRQEVRGMLLAELGGEFAVGLPVGLGLGWLLSWGAAQVFTSEMFRIPVWLAPRTYLIAAGVVTAAGLVSAVVVRRMLDRFDLVSVLKAYE